MPSFDRANLTPEELQIWDGIHDEPGLELPYLDEPDQGPYVDPVLPEPFLLQDDAGGTAGPFTWDQFTRDEETGTWVVQTEGRTIFLRVVSVKLPQPTDPADQVATLYSFDGGGRLWRYRVFHESPAVEKSAPRWDPDAHPRGADGRFISIGDWVKLDDGQRHRVSNAAPGFVELDGERVVPSESVTAAQPPVKKPGFKPPSPAGLERARRKLGLQLPVRVLPLLGGGRAGYAGVSRDPLRGRDGHLIFLAPATAGARNWALWHELGHAVQQERGEDFEPTTHLSPQAYADSPKEREAEEIAQANADDDLWSDE